MISEDLGDWLVNHYTTTKHLNKYVIIGILLQECLLKNNLLVSLGDLPASHLNDFICVLWWGIMVGKLVSIINNEWVVSSILTGCLILSALCHV